MITLIVSYIMIRLFWSDLYISLTTNYDLILEYKLLIIVIAVASDLNFITKLISKD